MGAASMYAAPQQVLGASCRFAGAVGRVTETRRGRQFCHILKNALPTPAILENDMVTTNHYGW